MGPWFIEPLSHEDIDDVLALEEASFTNPCTRAMYQAELANGDMSFCFLARDAKHNPVGFCSFWLVVDELHLGPVRDGQRSLRTLRSRFLPIRDCADVGQFIAVFAGRKRETDLSNQSICENNSISSSGSD